MKMKLVNSSSPYFTGILAIILGATMVMWPNEVLNYIVEVLGWFFILIGAIPLVMSLTKKAPIPYASIVLIIIGVLFMLFGNFFFTALMWFCGLVMLFAAINQINQLWGARNLGYVVSPYAYVSSALLLLAGVVMVFNPFGTKITLITFFGASILFYGVSTLVNEMLFKRKVQ